MSEHVGNEAAVDPQVSRRQILRRGAVVGAAAWAVPVVHVIGLGPADAQAASSPGTTLPPATTTTVPPATTTTTAPVTCKDISNIQIVVRKNGQHYGLKYDPAGGGEFTAWSAAAPDSNDCIRYFDSEYGTRVVASWWVAETFNGETRGPAAVVDIISDCEWRLRLPLPDGYTYVQGYVKSGNVSRNPCPKAGTPTGSYVAFVGE